MSLYLPTVNENWGDFILLQIVEQEDGYFLEVDLDYPEELHDTHDYYPCAPEKLKISEEYLSEHQKELGKKCGAKFGSEKLCLTLKPKVKYILHYRNLKQYLSLGLKLTKVHRVLKFKQSPWLKQYIDMNTQFRQEATNKFEGNLYKLMFSKKEKFKRWHIYNANQASVLMEKTSVTLN